MAELEFKDLKELLKRGNRGAILLSTLGLKHRFIEAINSEIGKKLLSDLIFRMEGLLDKIINGPATIEEKAEYIVTRDLIYKWSERIAEYEELLKKAKGE